MHAQNAARGAYARTALLKNESIPSSGTGAISHRYYGSYYEVAISPAPDLLRQVLSTQQADLHKLLESYTSCIFTTGINPVIEETKRELPSVVTPADMVNAVRNAFLLNVSDAARVFGVTRPTIYQWSTLIDIEQIRAHAVRNRMKELYRLSQEWIRLGPLTGRWTTQVLSSGQSVIDLLSAATIDRKSVLDAHAHLRAASYSLREAEAARALNAAKALGPAFDKLAALQEKRERNQS